MIRLPFLSGEEGFFIGNKNHLLFAWKKKGFIKFLKDCFLSANSFIYSQMSADHIIRKIFFFWHKHLCDEEIKPDKTDQGLFVQLFVPQPRTPLSEGCHWEDEASKPWWNGMTVKKTELTSCYLLHHLAKCGNTRYQMFYLNIINSDRLPKNISCYLISLNSGRLPRNTWCYLI